MPVADQSGRIESQRVTKASKGDRTDIRPTFGKPCTATLLPATMSDAAGNELSATLLEVSVQNAVLLAPSAPHQAGGYTTTFTLWGVTFTTRLAAIQVSEQGNGEYVWRCKLQLTPVQAARLDAIQDVWGVTGFRFRSWSDIRRDATQVQDDEPVAIAETVSGGAVQATAQACLNAGPGSLPDLVARTVGAPKLR